LSTNRSGTSRRGGRRHWKDSAPGHERRMIVRRHWCR
jgi:hypothetical protein